MDYRQQADGTDEQRVPRLIRDGMVAVLISPGYGAGWSTWNDEPERLLFHKDLVEAIEAGDRQKAEEIAEILCPGVYLGGLRDIQIKWLSIGTSFMVHEYDGHESIDTTDNLCFRA